MSGENLERLGLSQEERAVLTRYRFDAEAFLRLSRELAEGAFPPSRNTTAHTVSPPQPGDLTPWPAPGSPLEREWRQRGEHALRRGEVAVCILNGGMATRFGGVVKGVVEVLPGYSFLGLKLKDVASTGCRVPVFLMSSFATESDTRQHLEEHHDFGLVHDDLHPLTQRISLRLLPGGALARDPTGRLDYYAPGHGDVFAVLAASPALQQFRAAGGRAVLVSNVDNLGATLDAVVLGAHLALGRPVTVEVAPRAAGDKGGAPARVNGRVEVLEGFRFPPTFDIATIPVFNTNTLVVDTAAIRDDYPLTWFRADKTAHGRAVVQFERLMGEVTAFVDATYLEVPREGPNGRFLPVKTPEDLDLVRDTLRQRLAHALRPPAR